MGPPGGGLFEGGIVLFNEKFYRVILPRNTVSTKLYHKIVYLPTVPVLMANYKSRFNFSSSDPIKYIVLHSCVSLVQVKYYPRGLFSRGRLYYFVRPPGGGLFEGGGAIFEGEAVNEKIRYSISLHVLLRGARGMLCVSVHLILLNVGELCVMANRLYTEIIHSCPMYCIGSEL